MEPIPFEKALNQTNSPRILLLGNGFSCACAESNFIEEKKKHLITTF